MEEKNYLVSGMHCAGCAAKVERAVEGLEGVERVELNLLTGKMTVLFEKPDSPAMERIALVVEKAGFRLADWKEEPLAGTEREERLEQEETGGSRLVWSILLLVPLMYLSMGPMWHWPVPEGSWGLWMNWWTQGILAGAVLWLNRHYLINGVRQLVALSPNMDSLIAIGSGSAFLYGLYLLVAGMWQGFSVEGMELYFESAAMILALITVGKTLEAYSKGRTTDALKGLMDLAPKTAVLIRDGEEVTVDIDEVAVGDIFAVRPGESVPVDGVVLEGDSAVDESALSGESIPVDKTAGSRVSAATINQSGYLKCRATQVGADTALSKIIDMVSDAAATKAPIAKLADKVSGVFVPVVILIAFITMIVWIIVGKDAGYVLARGISVLVISCPCALGLATPVAIMVGNGIGAKHGILFKTATALEETGKGSIVVMDKTGTITMGETVVTDILAADGVSDDELMQKAAALEKLSEHPLARAVVGYYSENYQTGDAQKDKNYEVSDFKAVAGNGLMGSLNGRKIIGGNMDYIKGYADVPEAMKDNAEKVSQQGKTPMFFAEETDGDYRVLGIIAVADTVKEDSAEAISQLQSMGLSVVMLTGDNERTAKAIGEQVGVDRVIAGVRPDGKESVVRDLMQKGHVIMVGDGINDAPALTRANIGIAIGAGTDIAIDAADVVLMKSELTDVPAAIRLSRATVKNIKENLFWAFIYNIIGIPLAAGVWIPIFGWTLNPMFGAFAMSLSSFCVVTNALRLNLTDIYDKNKRYRIKEDKVMTKTMKIEGMMCGHCEARVKKSLEALDQVQEAVVSHETGTAVVTLKADVDDSVLKKTVEDQDYKVTSIQ